MTNRHPQQQPFIDDINIDDSFNKKIVNVDIDDSFNRKVVIIKDSFNTTNTTNVVYVNGYGYAPYYPEPEHKGVTIQIGKVEPPPAVPTPYSPIVKANGIEPSFDAQPIAEAYLDWLGSLAGIPGDGQHIQITRWAHGSVGGAAVGPEYLQVVYDSPIDFCNVGMRAELGNALVEMLGIVPNASGLRPSFGDVQTLKAIYGGPQIDPITGTNLSESLVGTEGNDAIRGRQGDDTLHGLGGNDVLFGGAGNDVLTGGPGIDWLVGGPGADTYVLDQAGNASHDVISWGHEDVLLPLFPVVGSFLTPDVAKVTTPGNELVALVEGIGAHELAQFMAVV